MSEKKKLEKKKKVIIIWIAALVLLSIAAVILLKYADKLGDEESGLINVTGSNGFYSDFYEPENGVPLEEKDGYEDFLDQDRALYYTKGNYTEGYSKEDLESCTAEIRFFGDYYDAMLSGDCELYNSMFTKSFFETHEKQGAFNPQMVYEMNITLVSSSTETSIREYVFDVTYKIFRNDGTFRKDIDSDATKPLQITIDDSEGEFRISDIR